MCGNWAHIAISQGENSQMINGHSRLGHNLSSVDSTTFINLDKNMLTWASYFSWFNGPILLLLLYYLGCRVSCYIEEMFKCSGLTMIEIYFTVTQ